MSFVSNIYSQTADAKVAESQLIEYDFLKGNLKVKDFSTGYLVVDSRRPIFFKIKNINPFLYKVTQMQKSY